MGTAIRFTKGVESAGGSQALVNEIDDVLRGRAREENFGNAGFFERGDVGFGDDAADENGNVVHALFLKKFHELRAECIVGARENGEANDVHVFLDGSGGDHLRGLAQPGVDDLHAGITQSASDHLGAAVVTIEPGLGNQYADFLLSHVAG